MSTTATATTPTLKWDSATDQGPRKDNQDRVLLVANDHPLLDSKGALLVLCDGVGGEEGGHVAAQLAVDEAHRAYYSDDATEPPIALKHAVDRAWLAVKTGAMQQHARMATTIVAVAIHGGALHVAHVGDSRAYLLRGGRLRQLTDDHTYVNQQLKQGMITPEDAKRSPYRGVLTRSLAAAADHTVDIGSEALQSGDRVLLCSDGLHGAVDTRAIEQILGDELETSTAAQRLVGMALQNKTGDNVTVAVLNYGVGISRRAAAATATTARIAIPQPMPERKRSMVPVLLGGVLVASLIAAGVYFLPSLLAGTQSQSSNPPSATALATTAGNVITPTAAVLVTSPDATALPTAGVVEPTLEAIPGAPTATQAIVPPTATRKPLPTSTRTPRRTPTPVASLTPVPQPVTVVPVLTAVPVATQSPPQQAPPQQPPPTDTAAQPPPPAATQPPAPPPAPTSPPENAVPTLPPLPGAVEVKP